MTKLKFTLVFAISTLFCFNTIGQTLTGNHLNIWSTNSHLARFGLDDNVAGATRPRVDIWGTPNKINLRTTYGTGGAALALGTHTVGDALVIKEDGQIALSNNLTIWSTNSHLARFGLDDNAAGATRPRVDIWGTPNKINLRTTYGTGGATLALGTHTVNDALLIAENGNIAISGKLEVKEIKVTLTPTADFVFEEDYNLRSLNEVEDFIKENKHLPEIASADEMVENGISLNEMNAKLLQKIEELTLYVIEMNKTVKSLKVENEEQKEKIERLELKE